MIASTSTTVSQTTGNRPEMGEPEHKDMFAVGVAADQLP